MTTTVPRAARTASSSVRLARLWGGVVTALTVLLAALWVFPLYWAAITSLKADNDTIANPPTFWPKPFDFSSYTYILQNSPLVRWYANSILTSLAITVLVLLLSLLCAYALSQIDFRGGSGCTCWCWWGS